MLVANEQEYLTIGEVAKRLRVDPETVRRWLNQKVLPGYQFGRQWRVRPDELEKFIEERHNLGDQPKADPETEKWPIIHLPEYGEEVSG